MQNKPTTAEIVILASGAVALVFSFLDWAGIGRFGASPWDGNLFFPTFAWVGIFGAAMAVVIALEVFATVKLPQKIHSFTWPQVHIVLGVFTALLTVSFLLGKPSGADYQIGYFISLLASAGLVVGAFMLDKERPQGVRPASPQASPGAGGPPPQSPPPQPGGGGGTPPPPPPS